MTKKIIAAMLLVLVCTTGLLVGCGATPVTEDDFDRIATYYFDMKLTEQGTEWAEWKQEADIIISSKPAYCLSAVDAEGNVLYSLGIIKDGSGVFNYGLTTGKATRIGGSDVGK